MDIDNDMFKQSTDWEIKFWSKKSPKLYKYRGDLYRDLFALQNNLIYIPSREQLNDPNESAIVFDDVYKTIREVEKLYPPKDKVSFADEIYEHFDNIGVYSMSKKPNIDCLWSYYANGHKGFCIEYDAKILKDFFEREYWTFCLDVVYGNKKYITTINNIREYTSKRKDFLRKTTATKGKNWKHEQEVRFVSGKKSDYLRIPSNAVIGVYIGVNCKDVNRKLVIDTAKNTNSNVKLYQMYFRKDSFDMYFEKI